MAELKNTGFIHLTRTLHLVHLEQIQKERQHGWLCRYGIKSKTAVISDCHVLVSGLNMCNSLALNQIICLTLTVDIMDICKATAIKT